MSGPRYSRTEPVEPFRDWRLAPERFRTWQTSPAPLLPAAIGMATGIALDSAIGLSLTVVVALVLLAGAVLIAFRRRVLVASVATAGAALALGAVLHQQAFRRVPTDHIVRYTADEPRLACLTGTLLSDPVVYERSGGHFASWIHGRRRTRLLVEAEQIMGRDGPISVSGLVQVYVKEPCMAVRAGDRVRVVGDLYRPSGPKNPGEFDWALRSRRQGMWVGMSCKLAASITRLETNRPTRAGLRSRLRDALRGWLYQDLWASDESASVLDAIVLGQRNRVTREMDEAFIRTGTAHFLCVSGTHVGMLAVVVWWLIRSAGAGRGAGAAIVLVIVGAYVFVSDPRVPILRAGILCALGCVAVGIRRRTSPLNWLAAGAIVILAWRPCDLFSAGFQLSFGVVLGILLLSQPIRASLYRLGQRIRGVPPELDDPPALWSPWRRRRAGLLLWLTWLATVSLAAWLVGSALTLYHFGRCSPWGWANSLLVWPLVMLLVVGGYAKVLLAGIWPQTALVTGPLLGGVSKALMVWVDCLNRLPFVSVECRPPAGWIVALYVLGLLAFGVAWHRGAGRRRLAACCGVSLAAVLAWALIPVGRREGLRMWVLSVGAGQAILLESPHGTHWMCDAGAMAGYDVGERVVVPALRHLGVRHIRQAIVSHANFDHYNGLLAIDDGLGIEQLAHSVHFARNAYPGSAARFLLDQLAERQIPTSELAAGTRLDMDSDVAVEVMWPPKDLGRDWSSNNCSLVLRVHYAGRSILICGDIEDEAQRDLIARGNLRADVLILPHHGAVVRSIRDFINAVDAQVVIRSGGGGREQSRAALVQLVGDRQYFDTSEDGAVFVTIGDEGLRTSAPFCERARMQ